MVQSQGLSEQNMLRAKTVIVEAVNKGKIQPCLDMVRHGFPINEPIMENGINLLMYVASTSGPTDLAQILQLDPDLNH